MFSGFTLCDTQIDAITYCSRLMVDTPKSFEDKGIRWLDSEKIVCTPAGNDCHKSGWDSTACDNLLTLDDYNAAPALRREAQQVIDANNVPLRTWKRLALHRHQSQASVKAALRANGFRNPNGFGDPIWVCAKPQFYGYNWTVGCAAVDKSGLQLTAIFLVAQRMRDPDSDAAWD